MPCCSAIVWVPRVGDGLAILGARCVYWSSVCSNFSAVSIHRALIKPKARATPMPRIQEKYHMSYSFQYKVWLPSRMVWVVILPRSTL